MNISIIPWHVFLDALKKQQPGTLELRLRRWLFTNERRHSRRSESVQRQLVVEVRRVAA
jgi:hypothetical protein